MEEDEDYHFSSCNNKSQSHNFGNHGKISSKYRIRHLWNKIESSLVFVTLANFFWLAYKSGTKPSRIIYPCQRAAVASISTFAIFPFLYSEKIKFFFTQYLKLNKLFSVKLSIASIFALILLYTSYTSPIVSPIEPGVYGKNLSQREQTELRTHCKYATIPAAYDLSSPHKVVTVHDSNSSTWEGEGNPNNYMNQTEIDKMVDVGVMELTETTSPQDGWRKIIPYTTGQSVAIKVNFNNNWHCSNGFYFNDDLDTSMLNYAAVVNSIIRGLKSIGVPSDKIWITDPSRPVHDQFRERIYDKGVQYYINQNAGAYIEERPNVFVTGYASDSSVYASTSTAYAEKIRPAQVFVDATYIINMPQLKGHGYESVGRVTLSLKNNFGSVYYTADDTSGNDPAHNADPFAKLVADINNNPVFRDKTRLVVGDGIMGNPNVNNAPPTLWRSFGNNPPETLFFGVDPVATDSVMIDYIRREVGSQATGLIEFYAAELGLGVLESWNDQEKYTYIDYHPINLDNQTYNPIYANPTVNKSENGNGFGLSAVESPIKYGFWYPTVTPDKYHPNWNSITHVAYPSWVTNGEGVLTSPQNMSNYNAVKNIAHNQGVKVIICVDCFEDNDIDSILANHREELANNVLAAIQANGADGVVFDFEFPRDTNSITQTSNTILFEELVKTINTKLKSANPNYHISYCIGLGVEGVYRNTNLKQYLDSIFIMGYDYHYRGASTTGPISPYNDPDRYDVIDTVNISLNYYDKQQLILGLPFYGYDWAAVSDQPGAATIGVAKSVDLSWTNYIAPFYGRLWDSNSNTPWYRYQDGDTWHQVWYDDNESIRLKYDYVRSENLGGIGFYALGLEGNNSTLWNIFLDQPKQMNTSVVMAL